MSMVAQGLALIVICYLVGSFPAAYLVGRLRYGVDIRELGDGNPGAENVWRSLGRPAGLAVGLVDIAKGTLAVFVGRQLVDAPGGAMLGGLAAVAGHHWPPYLGLRGGRGAATLMGALLLTIPQATIPLALLGALPLVAFRSTTAFFAFLYVALPPVAWLTGASPSLIGYAVAMAVLVGVIHAATKRQHRAYPAPGPALDPPTGKQNGLRFP
jgi:glycerol-3-phosphate acyltransferase PlsY